MFSFGVFGLILMTIMLFSPRGLLPALGDATAGVWERVRGARRPGATPSAQHPGGVLFEDERPHARVCVRTGEVLALATGVISGKSYLAWSDRRARQTCKDRIFMPSMAP